jgi:hypothetical protein
MVPAPAKHSRIRDPRNAATPREPPSSCAACRVLFEKHRFLVRGCQRRKSDRSRHVMCITQGLTCNDVQDSRCPAHSRRGSIVSPQPGLSMPGSRCTEQCTSGQAIPHRGRAWYPTGAWYWALLAGIPWEGMPIRQAMRSMRHAGPCSWHDAAGLRESGHAGPLTALPCCPACHARTALAERTDAAAAHGLRRSRCLPNRRRR